MKKDKSYDKCNMCRVRQSKLVVHRRWEGRRKGEGGGVTLTSVTTIHIVISFSLFSPWSCFLLGVKRRRRWRRCILGIWCLFQYSNRHTQHTHKHTPAPALLFCTVQRRRRRKSVKKKGEGLCRAPISSIRPGDSECNTPCWPTTLSEVNLH